MCESGQVHPGPLLALFHSLWPTSPWLFSCLPGWRSDASLRTEAGEVSKVGFYDRPERGTEKVLRTFSPVLRGHLTGEALGSGACPQIPLPAIWLRLFRCSTNSHSQRSSLRSASCRPHHSPRTDQSEACIVPGKPDLKKQRGEHNPCLQWGTTLLCSARESLCLPGAASHCWGAGVYCHTPLPTVFQRLGPNYPISGRNMSGMVVCAWL